MVAGAAEREGQAEAGHARQDGFEQAGVFGGELAPDEAGGGADAERGLEAGEPPLPVGGEPGRGFAQLQGVGLVLRVIDRQQIAGGPAEGAVEGAGFGGGAAWRRHHDLQPFGARRRQRGGQGPGIMSLQHQQALQPVRGIVEGRQAFDQLTDHLGLVIEGRQYGVARPRLRRRGRTNGPGAEQDQTGPPDRHGQEGGGGGEHSALADPVRAAPEDEDRQADQRRHRRDLRRRERPLGRALFERRAVSRGVAPAIVQIADPSPLHPKWLTR